jgi:outer membrane protein assembly factor BamB
MVQRQIRGIASLVLAACMLLACNQDTILPGQRIAILPEDGPQPRVAVTPVALPAPQMNASWTQVNGSAAHAIANPALGWPLTPVWSLDIGTGNSAKSQITGTPVIGNGTVFVMNAASGVTAVSRDGAVLWNTSLAPAGEKGTEGFGGGLALAGGRLFATTGFGEVLALSPETGGVLWRQRLSAVLRAAPVAEGGLVVAVARDDVAYGIDAETGRLLWDQSGIRGLAGLLGGAAPALSGGLLALPYASGEVQALDPATGEFLWSELLFQGKRGLVRSRIGDISSDPVIHGGRVYFGSQGGELVAVSAETGERLWRLDAGSYQPVWPAGDSIFVISDTMKLMRVNAAEGIVVWSVPLPEYTNPEKRKGGLVHFGPVLAGGKLNVAGSDGLIRSFDPVGGGLLGVTELPAGAAGSMAVAGGQMFIVDADGTLHAFQ